MRWSDATRGDLGSLLGLLGQEHGLDVGQHTTLGNGDAGQQLVQLLVVADGQLEVTRDDTGLLVVTGGVAGQLEHFGGQVLQNGGEVHWGTGTNSLGVVALSEQTVDTANGKLETSAGRAGLCLRLNFTSLATARHFQ